MERLSQVQPVYLIGKRLYRVADEYRDAAAGYIWIGLPKDVPEKYLDAEVMDTWAHKTSYPGTTIKLDFQYNGEGKWFWWEFDESIPNKTHEPLECQNENLSKCYAAIVRVLMTDYERELRIGIGNKRLKSPDCIRKEINRIHKYYYDLTFISGSSAGQYIIQRVEDEVFIYATHPELNRIRDVEKKFALIEKYRKEILAERAKKAGEGRYATWTRIKDGKKITHSVTGTVTDRKEDA